MVERKSKPRKKSDEDDEPTGMKKVIHSPWFLFALVIVIIVLAITGLFMLSAFLSAN